MRVPEIPIKRQYPNREAIAICAEIAGCNASDQSFRRRFIRWKQFLGIQQPGETKYLLNWDALEILVQFCLWKAFIADGNTPHEEFWDWSPEDTNQILQISSQEQG